MPPAATTPPSPTRRSGRSPPSRSSTTGSGASSRAVKQIDPPQVSIDGKGAAPAVRDRLDQVSRDRAGHRPRQRCRGDSSPGSADRRQRSPCAFTSNPCVASRKELSGACATAAIIVSAAITNSEPGTGTGRRLPLASGSPSSMRWQRTGGYPAVRRLHRHRGGEELQPDPLALGLRDLPVVRRHLLAGTAIEHRYRPAPNRSAVRAASTAVFPPPITTTRSPTGGSSAVPVARLTVFKKSTP